VITPNIDRIRTSQISADMMSATVPRRIPKFHVYSCWALKRPGECELRGSSLLDDTAQTEDEAKKQTIMYEERGRAFDLLYPILTEHRTTRYTYIHCRPEWFTEDEAESDQTTSADLSAPSLS